MGYRSLIDINLNRAFNMAKDLAVNITLIKKIGSTFDFATKGVTATTTENISLKGIWLEADKPSKEHNFTKRQIMFKRVLVGDISQYDSITDNGVTWRISNLIKDTGFITILEVQKEL